MDKSQEVPILPEDLPIWMRQAQRGTDWGIFIVLGFCLFACLPFFTQDGLPQTNDSEHYVYLGHDYATTLSEGRLYPRWSAHVQDGYGAPIPNFIPPGTAYTSALIQLLFTNNSVNAIRITYILAICLAGTMTYAFVSRINGSEAGVLASLLYIYSPYVILTAPHISGDLPATIAMGLLPCILWSTNRLLTINNSFDIFLASICLSALALTDPRFILVSFILIVVLLIHRIFTVGIKRSHLIQLGSSIILSIGISSFFWIPATLEQEHIQWIDNTNSFITDHLSLQNLITPLRQLDLGELRPKPQFTLGIPLVILSFLGFLLNLRFAKSRTLPLLFTSTGILLIVWGINYAPESTWIIGPISLCLAIGCAPIALSRNYASRSTSQLYPILLYILVLAGSYPAWLAPRWGDTLDTLTPESQILYEQSGYGIAILPSIWDLPTTISNDLESNRYLLASYDSSQIISHISTDQISAQSEAQIRDIDSHRDQYQICISQSATFDITRAFFPGWEAHIDNNAVNPLNNSRTQGIFCPRVNDSNISRAIIVPNEENGLFQVHIPNSSSGVLVLNFGTTDVRQGAWIISWVSLIVLILATINRIRTNKEQFYTEFKLLSLSQVRISTAILIGFGAVLIFFATPSSPFTLYALPLHSLRDTVAIQQRTDVGIELLTFDFNQSQFRVNDEIEVNLTWRTTRLLQEGYQVRVHLTDINHNIRWATTDFQMAGQYPTSRWETTRFIRDQYTLTVPEGIPLGDHLIGVEIFACRTNCLDNQRIIFFDNNRQSIGQTLYLPNTISILR